MSGELLARVKAASEWRSVPGWPYEASDAGTLRSIRTGRVLRVSVNHNGYEQAMFSVDKTRRTVRVHRAVYEAWFGPIPLGHQINHKDGNKRNNRPGNLEACTGAHNMRHASQSGLMATGDRNGARAQPERLARGSANGASKLTEDAVRQIRLAVSNGETNASVARRFQVSKVLIGLVVRGKVWSHV